MNRKTIFGSVTVWISMLSALGEALNQIAGDPFSSNYPKLHAGLGMAAMVTLALVRIFKTSAPILAPETPARPE